MAAGTPISLTPQSIPSGFCPSSWQAVLDQFLASTDARLPGTYNTFNFGDATPSAADRGKPWLRTISGEIDRWYVFENGIWISKHPIENVDGKRIKYEGTLASIDTIDGGNSNPVTDRDGPFWELDVAVESVPNASPTQVVFDSSGSGTWNVPSSVTEVLVELWGAGGGGGQDPGTATTDQVAGGGGGGHIRSSVTVTAGGTVSYTVGAGGAAGSGAPGSSGTDTVFGSLTAGGGGGGSATGTTSTASGGTNSGTTLGDVSLNGGSTTAVGQGGDSPLGGAGGLGGFNVNASAGSQPGGGGGGSYGVGSSGDGADGMIIITYTEGVTPTDTYWIKRTAREFYTVTA